MNFDKLRGIRVERRATAADCAKAIHLSVPSYYKKESGEVPLKLSEVMALIEFLHMSTDEVNAVFFDGRLTES